MGIVLTAGAALYWWSATHCHETDLTFRIELYGLPRSMAIVDPPSKTFEVRVRGPETVIDRLRSTELSYSINLADAAEGTQSISIESERLPLPPEVTVLAVSTGDTTLQLETTVHKNLPVTLRLGGKPAFGYEITENRVHPSRVELQGPESKLALLDTAPTYPVDIKGATETVRKNIALDLPEGVTVFPDTETLSATVKITEVQTQKTIDDIAVNGRQCHFSHVIQPETVRLTVCGAMRSLSDTFPIGEVSVYIDLKGLTPGIYVMPAAIHLPEGIRLVQAEPQVFTVQILETPPACPSGE